MSDSDPSTPDLLQSEAGRALIDICRELNQLGAKYIVVGEFALAWQGMPVLPDVIALLIEESLENQALVLQALEVLPDKASRELQGEDLRPFATVQVADAVTVELSTSLCGVSHAEAAPGQIVWDKRQEVRLPMASPILLWATKQTYLDEDEPHRAFLRERLRGTLPEEVLHPSPLTESTAEGFHARLWKKFF